ncbi:MAG: NAD(P)H-binding protein, partial [Myxococcota bacterium]
LAQAIVPHAAKAGVTRFYMVGGIGALWAPGTNKTVLMQDWDDAEAMGRHNIPTGMPRDMIQRMTAGHLLSMEFMERAGFAHTFLCPGRMLEGPATSTRVVTLDEVGGAEVLQVSFGDVAQVIIDDLEHGALIGHRVCVATR